MSKIMLVEDDNSLREIYGARLVAEGYEIVSAHDGEEALATAIKERPDLILTDIMMPKISGFDMIDILRSTTETKNIKIVIMTALSRPEDQKRGESLGADRYLVKSQVTLEDVAKAIRDTLDGNPNPTNSTAESETTTPQPPAPQPAPAPVTNPEPQPPMPTPSQFTAAQGPVQAPQRSQHTETVIQPPAESEKQPDLSDLVAQELAKEQASNSTNPVQTAQAPSPITPINDATPAPVAPQPTPQPAPPANIPTDPSQPQQ